MRRPYHVVYRLNRLMPSASVIKLLSNPRIPINALAYGSGINRNSQVANQLNNLASGINYYVMPPHYDEYVKKQWALSASIKYY